MWKCQFVLKSPKQCVIGLEINIKKIDWKEIEKNIDRNETNTYSVKFSFDFQFAKKKNNLKYSDIGLNSDSHTPVKLFKVI